MQQSNRQRRSQPREDVKVPHHHHHHHHRHLPTNQRMQFVVIDDSSRRQHHQPEAIYTSVQKDHNKTTGVVTPRNNSSSSARQVLSRPMIIGASDDIRSRPSASYARSAGSDARASTSCMYLQLVNGDYRHSILFDDEDVTFEQTDVDRGRIERGGRTTLSKSANDEGDGRSCDSSSRDDGRQWVKPRESVATMSSHGSRGAPKTLSDRRSAAGQRQFSAMWLGSLPVTGADGDEFDDAVDRCEALLSNDKEAGRRKSACTVRKLDFLKAVFLAGWWCGRSEVALGSMPACRPRCFS